MIRVNLKPETGPKTIGDRWAIRKIAFLLVREQGLPIPLKSRALTMLYVLFGVKVYFWRIAQ